MKQTIIVSLLLVILIAVVAMSPARKDDSMKYHTPEEIAPIE